MPEGKQALPTVHTNNQGLIEYLLEINCSKWQRKFDACITDQHCSKNEANELWKKLRQCVNDHIAIS